MPDKVSSVLNIGYPKSGNTWVCQSLINLGKKYDDNYPEYFDVYRIGRENLPIIPHPIISKDNKSLAVIKSHNYKPYNEFPHRSLINVECILRITRNPLDVLMSYLNYTKVEIRSETKSGVLGINKERWGEFFVFFLGLNDVPEANDWLNYSLNDMYEMGITTKATKSFVECGLSIPRVDSMSSSWVNNILSWDDVNVPIITVRYEDLIENLQKEVTRISEFLGLNYEELEKAFNTHRTLPSTKGEFFNKMTSYYSIDLVDRDTLLRMRNSYWKLIELCGYDDWNAKIG